MQRFLIIIVHIIPKKNNKQTTQKCHLCPWTMHGAAAPLEKTMYTGKENERGPSLLLLPSQVEQSKQIRGRQYVDASQVANGF
jgi:hypothetical protein